jgi:hypothetical protein
MEVKLIELLEKIPKDSYILFAGGYMQEAGMLIEKGYSHIYAISEDPQIYASPHYTKIKYLFARRNNTHYPDSFFDVTIITNAEYLSHPEAKRITINKGTIITGSDKGWNAEKVIKPELKRPKEINVVLATFGTFEGTVHTTDNMIEGLKRYGITCHKYKTVTESPKDRITIVEWEGALGADFPTDRELIIELHAFFNKTISFSFKRLLTDPIYGFWLLKNFGGIEVSPKRLILDPGYSIWLAKFLLGKVNFSAPYMLNWDKVLEAIKVRGNVVMMRSNELGEYCNFSDYYLMPHSAQPKQDTPIDVKAPLCLGTYGFAAPYKGFENVCDVAKKLNIPLLMFLSVNHLHKAAIKDTLSYAEHLKKAYNGKKKIHIEIGNFPQDELRKKLAPCTHLLSLQNEVPNISSSMRLMVAMNKPVISTDIWQAKEAQVIRVKKLSDITIPFLEGTRDCLTNQDDGTRYMVRVLEMMNSKQ